MSRTCWHSNRTMYGLDKVQTNSFLRQLLDKGRVGVEGQKRDTHQKHQHDYIPFCTRMFVHFSCDRPILNLFFLLFFVKKLLQYQSVLIIEISCLFRVVRRQKPILHYIPDCYINMSIVTYNCQQLNQIATINLLKKQKGFACLSTD